MSGLLEVQRRGAQRLRRTAIGVLLTVGLLALFVVGMVLLWAWRQA